MLRFLQKTPCLRGLRGDILLQPRAHLVFILAVGLFTYSNIFNVPFHFDDYSNIVENPDLRDVRNIWQSSKARWFSYFTFAINYHINGLNVFGYHIVNLCIHLVNASLVYWLVFLTFHTPFLCGRTAATAQENDTKRATQAFIAFFTALLFVSHPIQTQAVTYISQRFTSLATLWYLLSLALYAEARVRESSGSRKTALKTASVLSAILAMTTKEIAFTLPFAIAVYECLFFHGAAKKRALLLAPFFLTLFIIPLAYLSDGGRAVNLLALVDELTRSQTTVSRASYLITQVSVIGTYLRLLLVPVGQNFDYDYPIYHSFFSPDVFVPFMILSLLFGLGVHLLIRSRSARSLEGRMVRLISFGIFWFFLTLAIESSFVPIIDVIFEHRVYLPSTGAFLALTTSLSLLSGRLLPVKLSWRHSFLSKMRIIRADGALLQNNPSDQQRGDTSESHNRSAFGPVHPTRALPNGQQMVFVVLLASTLAFSFMARSRNAIWTDAVILWEDVVAKSAGKARARLSLGVAYCDRGWYDKTIEQYMIALASQPHLFEYLQITNNLGYAYYKKGWIDEAIKQFRIVLGFDAEHLEARQNLAHAYLGKGWNDKAIEEFQVVLQQRPSDEEALLGIGLAYENTGRHDQAMAYYQQVLRIGRGSAEAHHRMGILYAGSGRLEDAIRELHAAVSIKPDLSDAYYHLSLAYDRIGLSEKAGEYYSMARILNPTLPNDFR